MRSPRTMATMFRVAAERSPSFQLMSEASNTTGAKAAFRDAQTNPTAKLRTPARRGTTLNCGTNRTDSTVRIAAESATRSSIESRQMNIAAKKICAPRRATVCAVRYSLFLRSKSITVPATKTELKRSTFRPHGVCRSRTFPKRPAITATFKISSPVFDLVFITRYLN